MIYDTNGQFISVGDFVIFSDKEFEVFKVREHPWMFEWSEIFIDDQWIKAIDTKLKD